MKLTLQSHGDDCVLVLPQKLVEKFRMNEADALYATVNDDGSLTISADDPEKGKPVRQP